MLQHGGAPPLSPLLSWLLGSHGGGKNVAFGGCNSWVEDSPMSVVSSLYIASRISVSPSRVAVDRAYLGRPNSESVKFYVQNVPCEISNNFMVGEFSVWHRLQPLTWPSSKKVLRQISRKSRFESNKVSSCILGNSYTSKCKARTLCTFATISRLVQINYKLYIKTSVKSIILAYSHQKL
jgi:hypothetical protein